MRITSIEFVRDPAAVSERARAEPVTITEGDRDELVLLSATEYARLKAKDRRRVEVDLLDDETAALIAKAEVPAEYAYLDDLLGDWEPEEVP